MPKITNRTVFMALMASIAFEALQPAYAQSDSATGAVIAARGGSNGALACVACHGSAGEGNPAAGFPRLAGLNPRYIEEQLSNFARDYRPNGVMSPIAARLTPSEKTALALFYGSLPWAPVAGAPGAGQGMARDAGGSLIMRGRGEQNIPACIQCHGPAAQGVGAVFPPLRGQSAAYIAAQLRAFKTGKRPGGPGNLMGAVAKRLSDADVIAIANHFGFAGQAQGTDPGRSMK